MLTVRDHGVDDYADLHDMDATDVGILSDDDRACLAEVGRLIVDTGNSDRLAMWLLHKHFDPTDGEVFVEKVIQAPREIRTAPVQRSDCRELDMTAVRLDDRSDSGVGVVGMEFASPADFGDTSPLSDDDEAALSAIAGRLKAHGKLDRFGVRLIRNPLGLSDGELLNETFHSVNRTLHCSVAERDAVLSDQGTVQTAWRWTVMPGESGPVVMQQCTATCQAVGEGHDLLHEHQETESTDT
jgi:hypothetical protein